jgi:hypothetical protein
MASNKSSASLTSYSTDNFFVKKKKKKKLKVEGEGGRTIRVKYSNRINSGFRGNLEKLLQPYKFRLHWNVRESTPTVQIPVSEEI